MTERSRWLGLEVAQARSVTLAIAASFVLMVVPLVAQQPGLRVYSIRDGLKFSQVFAVTQDSRGFIWAGTSFGVGRYDGRGFVNLSSAQGLPHDSVRGIAEDDEGGIWILTQEGLARVDARAATSEELVLASVPEPLASLPPRALDRIAAGGGAVWFAGPSRLMRLRAGRVSDVTLGEPGEVAWLGPVDEDHAWIGTASDLMRVGVGSAPERIALPRELGAPVAVVESRRETLLVQERGVSRLGNEGFVHEAIWQLPEGVGPRGAVRSGERLVVLTTDRGVLLLERGLAARPLDTRHGLPSDSVHSAIVDRDGLLWLATENGLVKIFDLSLGSFPSMPPTIGSMVLSFADDGRGGMWVGHSEGLSHVEGDRVRAVQLGGRGQQESVWGLLALPDGGVLAGTRRRIVYADGKRLRQLPDIFPGSPRIQALRQAPDGRIWVSSAAGVARFRWDAKTLGPADVEVYTTIEGSPFGEARGIDVAPDGRVWFGTDGEGVVLRDGSRFVRFGPETGLPDGACRAVLARPEGLWVGTTMGPYLLANGVASPVAALRDEKGDRYAVAMVDDGEGGVWLALPYSVVRIRGGRVAESWDQGRGLVGSSTTSENCIARDGRGALWVGMVGGFSVIGREAASRPPADPDVTILAAVDGKGNRVTRGSVIAHDANTLNLTYRSLTYVAEDRTRFQERLTGYETEWSAPHLEAGQRYTNLEPGEYGLEVRAVAVSGDVGTRIASLPFRVAPPWWRTVAARAVALLVGCALVYTAFYARTLAIRRRNRQLEALVTKRTEELEAANCALERLAETDGLTGVANRRVFDTRMRDEWLRGTRTSTPIALLMIDIDFFKAYNDTQGHIGGDDCLRSVAGAIASRATRTGDLVARYGGEEFVVILPGIDVAGAAAVGERMLVAVAALAIAHPASTVAPHVTISVGVASRVPRLSGSALDLVAAADAALYEAKRGGRNQVRVAAAGAESAPVPA